MSDIPVNDATANIPVKPEEGMDREKRRITPVHIPSPVKVYTSNIGKSRAPAMCWEQPEWDLAETGRILDTEAYVRRAFRNKKNLFLKEGYEFTGSNPDRVRYIKQRLSQIERATQIPFPVLMDQTVAALVRQSNAMWVKVRDDKASGGKIRKTPEGKELKPIAGYFIVPMETMRIKRDEWGKILGWRQEVRGKIAAEFKPEDIIHFYLDKREGFAVGTPVLVSVKDDIRALRRIEENVELLVYQHLFPLFHYQVGTEEKPAGTFADGVSEIEVIRAKVAEMPTDGCWVTPERHKITPLGAQGYALPVDNVIKHFKQRIFTGLGNSIIDMGEGGSAGRSTAQTMSRNLVDDTKADQKIFGSQFFEAVIKELLAESTFSETDLYEEENAVYLKFKEIDIEARHAKENHLVDIFLKNAITHDELRVDMGREPFRGEGWPTSNSKKEMMKPGDGDFARTAYGLFDRDKILLQSIDEPGTPESRALTKASATKPAASSSGGSVTNKSRPANQHGVRPSTKLNKDDANPTVFKSLDVVFKQTMPMKHVHSSLRQDLPQRIRTNGANLKEIETLIGISFEEARTRLINLTQRAYRIGLQDTGTNPWDVNLTTTDTMIQRHLERYINKLRDELIAHIDRNTVKHESLKSEDAVFVEMILKGTEYRADQIDNSEILRAYNYGLSHGLQKQGVQKMKSFRTRNDSCEICDHHVLSYNDTDAIIYEELPPYHPFCNCTMMVEEA